MAIAISLTEAMTFIALRKFLISIMPNGMEIVRGEDNRVAEPVGPDFITMSPLGVRERLSTNITEYSDGYPNDPQIRADMEPTKVTVQIDVHGPMSADNAQIITTLFQSDFGFDKFTEFGYDVSPLFASEPRHIPFTNGEQQIELRWSIDLAMQCNPVITNSQEFAAALAIHLINVDVVYPPT
jgi:hypothetical protein